MKLTEEAKTIIRKIFPTRTQEEIVRAVFVETGVEVSVACIGQFARREGLGRLCKTCFDPLPSGGRDRLCPICRRTSRLERVRNSRARKAREHLPMLAGGVCDEVTAQLAARQKYRCAACKEKKDLVVDYDQAGKVRALLCGDCSAALRLLGSSQKIKKLLEYSRRIVEGRFAEPPTPADPLPEPLPESPLPFEMELRSAWDLLRRPG